MKWVRVTDRLPQAGARCLVATKGRRVVSAAIVEREKADGTVLLLWKRGSDSTYMRNDPPTHWMPWPALPPPEES